VFSLSLLPCPIYLPPQTKPLPNTTKTFTTSTSPQPQKPKSSRLPVLLRFFPHIPTLLQHSANSCSTVLHLQLRESHLAWCITQPPNRHLPPLAISPRDASRYPQPVRDRRFIPGVAPPLPISSAHNSTDRWLHTVSHVS
jgi:hypothetical protein